MPAAGVDPPVVLGKDDADAAEGDDPPVPLATWCPVVALQPNSAALSAAETPILAMVEAICRGILGGMRGP